MHSPSRAEQSSAAFARVDLLFVLVTLGLFFGLFAPAFAKSQVGSRFVECLANKRRLMAAWSGFTADNSGLMPGSYFGGDFPNQSGSGAPYYTWASGYISWTSGPDNTNVAYLTDKRYSSLAPYLAGSISAFRCPEDVFVTPSMKAARIQRLRSVSANATVGPSSVEASGLLDSYFRYPTNIAQLSPQSPSQIWAYADEHPDSINDPTILPPRTTDWLDIPSTLHDRGGAFAFADGHGEIHQWKSVRMALPVRYNFFPPSVDVDMRSDIAWVRDRSPHR